MVELGFFGDFIDEASKVLELGFGVERLVVDEAGVFKGGEVDVPPGFREKEISLYRFCLPRARSDWSSAAKVGLDERLPRNTHISPKLTHFFFSGQPASTVPSPP